MKNIYDVLKRKEAEVIRLQKEIDSLRVAVRILEEEDASATEMSAQGVASNTGSGVPVAVSYNAKPATSMRNFP